jgi:hypothetical protein
MRDKHERYRKVVWLGKAFPFAFAASVALSALLFACGGETSSNRATSMPAATNSLSASATEKALPPPTSQPSPTPLIAGPDVRLCHRADITTAASPNGAGGMSFAFITLGNRSPTACQIKQPPGVELLDLHGDALPISVTRGQPCPAITYCLFQQPLLLLPGLPAPSGAVAAQPGQAVLILTWSPVDGSGGCATQPPKATQVRLLLQDAEDEVVIDVTSALPYSIAPCDGTVALEGYGPGTGD